MRANHSGVISAGAGLQADGRSVKTVHRVCYAGAQAGAGQRPKGSMCAAFDRFNAQGDAPSDGSFLLGQVNDATSAFPHLLEQLVMADARANRFIVSFMLRIPPGFLTTA